MAFKKIAILLLSVIIFFGTLEAIQRVRYFYRYKSAYWLTYGFGAKTPAYDATVENEMKGKVLKEIASSLIRYDGYYKCNPKNTQHKINSHGFRGKEFNIAKEAGVYRIVILGGSTTYGIGVSDDYTYPVLLGNKLSKDRVEVINAGIPQAHITNIANLFKKEIIKLNPDMVIINVVANNFMSLNLVTGFNYIQILNQKLLNISLFYMTLKEKLMKVSHRPTIYIYRNSFDKLLKNLTTNKDFYKNIENRYADIIKQCKDRNIKVILVKEPYFPSNESGILWDKRFIPVWDKMYSLLEDIGKRYNVSVVGFNTENRGDLFLDGVHLTNAGSDYVSDLLLKEIRKEMR